MNKSRLKLSVIAGLFLVVCLAFSIGRPAEKVIASSNTVEIEGGLVLEFDINNSKSSATVVGYKGNNTGVVIPDFYGEHPVLYIAKSAFEGNDYITEVVVPETVDCIYKYAFKDCKSLCTFTVLGNHNDWYHDYYNATTDHLLDFEENIFDGCEKLEYLELNTGWEYKKNSSSDDATIFAGSGLKHIRTVVDGWCHFNHAFDNCLELETIDAICTYDQGSSKNLGINLFTNIPKLKELNVYIDDRSKVDFGLVYQRRTDGTFNTKQITDCPNFKSINLFFTESCIGKSGKSAMSGQFTSSNPAVVDKVENAFGEYTLLGKGTTVLTSTVTDIVFTITVGDPEDNRVDIADAEVTLPVDSFTFCGSEIVPYAKLTLAGTRLTEGTDYSVSCKDNVEIGKATVTFNGIGGYKGSITAEYSIVPDPISVKQIASGKKYKITVNTSEQADGYQLYYSTKKSSGYKKLDSSTSDSFASTKLKSGHFIKVRAYKKVGKTTYYSVFSTPIKLD